MPELLTHSRLACARDCLRRHQLRFEHLLVPAQESYALGFGKAYHRLHEEGDGWCAHSGMDPFLLAAARELWLAWPAGLVAEYVAIEKYYERQICNPETGRATPNWRFAGLTDAIVRLTDGRLAILERKTTSDDIASGSNYWRKLELDSQTTGYFVGARAAGFDVSAVLYDVAARPTHRPLLATPVSKRKYTKPTKKDPISHLYADQRDRDETVEEFATRVREAIRADIPGYFQQREVPMGSARIEEYHRDVWWQQVSLRRAQLSGCWYRNPEACTRTGGRVCEYLAVCHLTDTDKNTPAGFVRLDGPHPELTSAQAQTMKET